MASRRTALIFLGFSICQADAQTTQGLIRGDVLNASDGRAIANCSIAVRNEKTSIPYDGKSGAQGEFVLNSLSPGTYLVRVDCEKFQSQELHRLELRVASQLTVSFRMRPIDEVWEDQYRRSVFLPSQSVLVFYGPDVDMSRTGNFSGQRGTPGALEATVSQVIDKRLLLGLPLAGRDAYTLLATQPGVTSDTTTTRSLGLSVNGQRPSESQFLLDGLENNDNLVTGPLSPLPPELVSEYRVTTNNFSAEYGRTSGFLANAITATGSDEWHGIAYGYGRHDAWNANSFPRNTAGLPRLPAHDFETGVSVGGRIRRSVPLFLSGAFDIARLRSAADEQTWTVPRQPFLDALQPGTIAHQFLTQYAPPSTAGSGPTGDFTVAPPVSLNRITAVPRADWVGRDGKHRLLTRFAFFQLERPDLVFSPYEGFNLPLARITNSIAVSWITRLRASWTNELRFGLSFDRLSAERPHPDVPILGVAVSTSLPNGLTLPGSPAATSYLNRSRAMEIGDNLGGVTGRHVWKAGGGFFPRRIDGYLRSYAEGRFDFLTPADFARDAPSVVTLSLARNDPVQAVLPDFDRQYRLHDWYAFVQDNILLPRRFSLSLGLRYDGFGAPVNVGRTKDHLLVLGPGNDLPTQIAGATLLQTAGDQQLYRSESGGPAIRVGVTHALRSDARTVIRFGYGMYRDRVFDNLWQTARVNGVLQLNTAIEAVPRNYLDLPALLGSLPSLRVSGDFPEITAFETLRAPLVHSGMAGVQQLLRSGLLLEANFLFSRSDSLLTTDRWNRDASVAGSGPASQRRFNNSLPALLSRGNDGSSDYKAVTLTARQQTAKLIWQASYSWSVSHDNQSDPLLGAFYDLGFGGPPVSGRATFVQQFDPSSSRGPSDFDQRHNLVVFGLVDLPTFLRGWQVGGLAAFRSGFPFTVLSPFTISTPPLLQNSADVVNPGAVWANRSEVTGGVQLLNASAFASAGSHVGSSGRNGYYGPGLLNVDLSVSRRFPLRQLGEQSAIGFRVDAFNVLNHANLGNPESRLGNPNFGIALKGRTARPNAFRLFGPLDETGRRIQLSVRFEF